MLRSSLLCAKGLEPYKESAAPPFAEERRGGEREENQSGHVTSTVWAALFYQPGGGEGGLAARGLVLKSHSPLVLTLQCLCVVQCFKHNLSDNEGCAIMICICRSFFEGILKGEAMLCIQGTSGPCGP